MSIKYAMAIGGAGCQWVKKSLPLGLGLEGLAYTK
jgi:hypothetical protein